MNDHNARVIKHDLPPKSTPSREQLKTDLRLRCERRLRESLEDSRRSLMKAKREGGGENEFREGRTLSTNRPISSSSFLSPMPSSSSIMNYAGEIPGSSARSGPTSFVHNMLQEIMEDEMMHTPIADNHRRGGGGGGGERLIRPPLPYSGGHISSKSEIYSTIEDDYVDPLSNDELLEMLLEIESSVLTQERGDGEEEEEDGPPEPVDHFFERKFGSERMTNNYSSSTASHGERGRGRELFMSDHFNNKEFSEDAMEGKEEIDMELLSIEEEQKRRDEEDAYYARLAEDD